MLEGTFEIKYNIVQTCCLGKFKTCCPSFAMIQGKDVKKTQKFIKTFGREHTITAKTNQHSFS